MRRSDTLAAQVAALDMVMVAIEEGRDMRAFVGGMLTAAKRERDAALEAEYEGEHNDPINGIDNGPCSDFAPDTLGPDPSICTTCFYQSIDHRVAAIEREHEKRAEVYPVGTAYANRITAALDAKEGVYSPPFSKVSYNGDYPDGEEPTCDICGRAQDDPPCGYGDPDWDGEEGQHLSCQKDKEPHAFLATPVCYYCGRSRSEHDEQPLELHGIWAGNGYRSDAISVRAAFAFGDWPPTGKGE